MVVVFRKLTCTRPVEGTADVVLDHPAAVGLPGRRDQLFVLSQCSEPQS